MAQDHGIGHAGKVYLMITPQEIVDKMLDLSGNADSAGVDRVIAGDPGKQLLKVAVTWIAGFFDELFPALSVEYIAHFCAYRIHDQGA